MGKGKSGEKGQEGIPILLHMWACVLLILNIIK